MSVLLLLLTVVVLVPVLVARAPDVCVDPADAAVVGAVDGAVVAVDCVVFVEEMVVTVVVSILFVKEIVVIEVRVLLLLLLLLLLLVVVLALVLALALALVLVLVSLLLGGNRDWVARAVVVGVSWCALLSLSFFLCASCPSLFSSSSRTNLVLGPLSSGPGCARRLRTGCLHHRWSLTRLAGRSTGLPPSAVAGTTIKNSRAGRKKLPITQRGGGTSSRPLLDLCSTSARPLLGLCSASARPVLV